MNGKIIAYRSGSLDAFIAAFIYWKLFKSTLGQTYMSVDPFTDKFSRDVTERTAPEFVISIGANVEKIFSFSSFFSYEVAETFPVLENSINWNYTKDSTKSLTQLILEELNKAEYIDRSSPEFVVMNQFLKFDSKPGWVIDPQVAQDLAVLMPNMQPEDFEVLDKLLFAPASALAYFGKKSATDIGLEYVAAYKQRASATVLKASVMGREILLINSGLYDHPNLVKFFKDQSLPVLVYETMSEGIRGKLIAPTLASADFNATTFFPAGRVSGDQELADVLLPLSTFAILFA